MQWTHSPARQQDSPSDAPRSLLTDPEGETCPGLPVFRHPLYRHLRWVTRVAMPGAVLAGAILGSVEGFAVSLVGCGIFMGGTVATLLIANQHAGIAAAAEARLRAKRRHRFLCPHCLRAGPVRYGCSACGEEVEAFVVLTDGLYLNDCPHCRARIFALRGLRREHELTARCAHCGHNCDRAYHQREVRVLAVLGPSDLDELAARDSWHPGRTEDTPFLWRDDGERLHYAVAAGGESAAAPDFPPGHAARRAEALWLGPGWTDPLLAGERIDRYLRRAGLDPARRASLPVLLADADPPSLLRTFLASRFAHITAGVSAQRLLDRQGVREPQAGVRRLFPDPPPDAPDGAGRLRREGPYFRI